MSQNGQHTQKKNCVQPQVNATVRLVGLVERVPISDSLHCTGVGGAIDRKKDQRFSTKSKLLFDPIGFSKKDIAQLRANNVEGR